MINGWEWVFERVVQNNLGLLIPHNTSFLLICILVLWIVVWNGWTKAAKGMYLLNCTWPPDQSLLHCLCLCLSHFNYYYRWWFFLKKDMCIFLCSLNLSFISQMVTSTLVAFAQKEGWKPCSGLPLGDSQFIYLAKAMQSSSQRLWRVSEAVNHVTAYIYFWTSFNQYLLSLHY